MPDIRSQISPNINGKLIYQLTSASALKDTDLFPISSTDNLTRNVSLGQIKASFNNDFYNKEDMDTILDILRQQIKNSADDLFELNNNITEFRNEFNNKLFELDNSLRHEINEVDKKFTNITNELDAKFTKSIADLDLKTTLADNALHEKIDNLEIKLTQMITNWILYGTEIPTSLPTGRVYLQYF